ncbi:MAG: addiction module protein [Longimicrobiales bacterium]
MSSHSERVKADALRLPIHERARLAEQLIASLDEDSEIEAAWAEEIERRMEEVRAGKVELLDADQVLAKLRNRLHK